MALADSRSKIGEESAMSSDAPSSTASSEQESLKQCLKLLRGGSDEHKFAGLLMVTKHVRLRGNSADAINAETLRRIFDAVGVPFLHRLLKTEQGVGADTCTGRVGNQGLAVYQHIALGVLAAFCVDRTMAQELVPFAPALVRTFRHATVNELDALLDAITCVHALSAIPEGMARLLRAGAAEAAVSRVAEMSKKRQKREDEAKGKSQGSMETESVNVGAEQGSAAQVEMVTFMFLSRAVAATGGQCLGPADMTTVAECFRDDPSPRKFTFMGLMLRWFSAQDGMADADEHGLSWMSRGAFANAVREGLVQAFHGGAQDNHRDEALTLLAVMLRGLGQGWAVEEEGEENARRDGEGKTEEAGRRAIPQRKRGTFVAFAMRGAGGEVRILLDESLSLLLPSNSMSSLDDMVEKARGPMTPAEGEKEDIAVVGKRPGDGEGGEQESGIQGADEAGYCPRIPQQSAERVGVKERRVARLLRMLPVALGVVESAIMFLCEGGDDGLGKGEEVGMDLRQWVSLPVQTLQDLQKTLRAVFETVLEFLAEIRLWVLGRPPTPGAPAEINPGDLWVLQRLGLECARALGAWVAEDPESLQSEFLEELPVLLALKARDEPPDSDDESSDSETEDNSSHSCWPVGATPQVALPYLLRALLALSYDDTPLAAIVEAGVVEHLMAMVVAAPGHLRAFLSCAPLEPPARQASAILGGGSGSRRGGHDHDNDNGQERYGQEEGGEEIGAEVEGEVEAESLRGPLICACGLLVNILTRAGHLVWPGVSAEKAARRHPRIGDGMAALAEVAGLAASARRAGGGVRWRLLIAHCTCAVLVGATEGPDLPEGFAERTAAIGSGAGAGGGGGEESVWEGMARAVDEALGTMSTVPGVGLIGSCGGEEEASYEEGSIWQWSLECARELLDGGAAGSAYVSSGVVPRQMLRSLQVAARDRRI